MWYNKTAKPLATSYRSTWPAPHWTDDGGDDVPPWNRVRIQFHGQQKLSKQIPVQMTLCNWYNGQLLGDNIRQEIEQRRSGNQPHYTRPPAGKRH